MVDFCRDGHILIVFFTWPFSISLHFVTKCKQIHNILNFEKLKFTDFSKIDTYIDIIILCIFYLNNSTVGSEICENNQPTV